MYVRLAFAVAAHRSTWLTAAPEARDHGLPKALADTTNKEEGVN